MELAWDLMEVTYLWPPLAERELSPQVVTVPAYFNEDQRQVI
jgi:hypothetical protein